METPGTLDALVLAAYAVFTLVVGVWDIVAFRIPDVLVLPALTGLVLALGAFEESGAVVRAVIGGVATGILFLLIALGAGSLGGGDVKLALLTGGVAAWRGWESLALALFSTGVIGALSALPLVLSRRRDSRAPPSGGSACVPYAPALLLGCWAGVVHGRAIVGAIGVG